ncbi:MAG: TldD/PmbA family protein [Oscillospiraceae bacterium]|nr:TldD/PmbA family protein [Oscillospiraceae bacterium]
MDFQTFRQFVADEAAALRIEAYELYYELFESTSASAFRHEINEFSSSSEGGVCLRCLVNGKMGYASTQLLSEESARALVRRAADNAATLENDQPEYLAEGGQNYQDVTTNDAPRPTADALRRAALAGQDALYAQAGVVDGSETQIFSERICIAICNSKGLDLRYENSFDGAALAAVVSDGTEGGEKANEYKISLGELDKLDLGADAAEAADGARAALGAGVPPTGAMPVVFSPKAMSQLLGTYAGVFSAENVQKGLSLLKDKEGETIAAPIVTLVDDPFYAKSAMPMPFDAEGSPTFRKNVIENGVLNTLLYNLRTAAAAGKATTGNAAKENYDAQVEIQPFTMYLASGELTQEQLLEKAGNGVLIDFLGGLHAGANTISGDFSLQSAGFLIENGKKTAPVRSFTVAGNFFSLLKGIAAVGNDPKTPTSESPTAFVSPSVLVEGLSIAGK